jgi:DNA-binding MarR family transcriptional regulator
MDGSSILTPPRPRQQALLSGRDVDMAEGKPDVENSAASLRDSLSLERQIIRFALVFAASSWARLDLTLAQLKVLLLVASRGGASVGWLAKHIGVTNPNMTGILDRLEDRDLIQRVRQQQDRRMVRIEVTEGGDELLRSLAAGSKPLLTTALSSLTPREQQALGKGLRALSRAFKGLHAKSGPPSC